MKILNASFNLFYVIDDLFRGVRHGEPSRRLPHPPRALPVAQHFGDRAGQALRRQLALRDDDSAARPSTAPSRLTTRPAAAISSAIGSRYGTTRAEAKAEAA